MNILFVDASVRPDSRTKRIAEYILNKIGGKVKKINLSEENIKPLNREALEFRTQLTNEQNFNNAIFHYAHDYANADLIIIVAPYWDLSFPASLKNYIEAVNVNGIVFKYDEEGDVLSFCNAKKLIYITTAGGKILSDEFGYGYIKTLAKKFHGIDDVEYIKAEELDIQDSDVEEILKKAEKQADKIIEKINKE